MSDIDWNTFSNSLKQPLPVDMNKWDTPKQFIKPNTSLNFEQRVLFPSKYPVLNNPDGSHSTHLMSWGEVDGKYVAFPTVIQDKGGNLIKLPSDAAFRYAMENREYREFDNADEASEYAEGGYKNSWGIGERR
jgi:hypothetical protein